MSSIFDIRLSKEAISDNRQIYMLALKHLFVSVGKSMINTIPLHREVDGKTDYYSKLVYALNEHGLEPIYYDYRKKQWVRNPVNEQYALLLNRYLEPDPTLEQMVNDLVLKYLIGDVSISTLSWKTSHLYKELQK